MDVSSSNEKQPIRLLCLAEGGARGAFQAGVFNGLVAKYADNLKELAYDYVTGVSVGVLNMAAISVFKPGEEEKAADLLNDIWLHEIQGSESIYKHQGWFDCIIIESIQYRNKPSIYLNDPLKELAKKIFANKYV